MKIYRALLNQTGFDAPTAIVLENTLGGDITWFRDEPGYYRGDLTGAFPLNKTFPRIGNGPPQEQQDSLPPNDVLMTIWRETEDEVIVQKWDLQMNGVDVFENIPVEILVY